MNIPSCCLFIFALEMVTGKERVKGRGLTDTADPCNAATGKIKERETTHRLATELHLNLDLYKWRRQS